MGDAMPLLWNDHLMVPRSTRGLVRSCARESGRIVAVRSSGMYRTLLALDWNSRLSSQNEWIRIRIAGTPCNCILSRNLGLDC